MTDKAAPTPGIASPSADGVSAQTRTMLWILLIVYIFNFLDRQIVNILAEPIKADHGLSDTQLGLLAEIGSASRRERGGQYVEIQGVAVVLKKKNESIRRNIAKRN